MKKHIIFLVLLCLSQHLTAQSFPEFLKIPLSFKNPNNHKQKITLNILRMPNKNAQAIILSHALALSYESLYDLGISLWQKGYDVWLPNMRGHGIGEHKSLANIYLPQTYSFESIVTQDWPYLLDHVYSISKQKVIIIGHSVGGMTWEQCLCGVFTQNNVIKQSNEIAKKRSQKVLAFIGLTVPSHFKKLSSFIKKSLKPIYSILPKKNYFLPLAYDKENSSAIGSFSLYLRKVFIFFSRPGLKFFLSKEILNYDNISEKNNEFEKILDNGVSSLHSDILHDFFRWIYEEGYISQNQKINFSINKKLYVPSLLYAGSLDKLVTFSTVNRSSKQYPNIFQRKVIILDEVSHIDIIFKKYVKTINETLINFIEDIKNNETIKKSLEIISI